MKTNFFIVKTFIVIILGAASATAGDMTAFLGMVFMYACYRALFANASMTQTEYDPLDYLSDDSDCR